MSAKADKKGKREGIPVFWGEPCPAAPTPITCRSLTTMQGGFLQANHTGILPDGICSQLSFSTSQSMFFLCSQFKNPLILLLLASALVSVITKEYEDAASITMVGVPCPLSPQWVSLVPHIPMVVSLVPYIPMVGATCPPSPWWCPLSCIPPVSQCPHL